MIDGIKTATADVVSAYVAGNKVSPDDLAMVIKSVFQSLCTLGEPEPPKAPEKTGPTGAQIRKSITPDALISFEDGRAYKTLKRHLSKNGLTIEAYKDKWGLPKDYPTTAANYSAKRSAMAKSLGLGNLRKAVVEIPAAPKTVKKAVRAKKVRATKS